MSSVLPDFPKELADRINLVIAKCPESESVFIDVCGFLKGKPESRKRKIEVVNLDSRIDKIDASGIVVELKDISFQSPLRKKMSLVFAVHPASQEPYLAVCKPGEAPELVLNDLSRDNIEFACLLPTSRDKPHLQTLLLFYKHNQDAKFNSEPLILTVNEDILKNQLAEKLAVLSLNAFLEKQAQMFGFNLTSPFQEKASKAFFVDAYNGSKEGTLYFLPQHILFGYKKPVLLFQSHQIEAITYTSITRLTFNLNVVMTKGEKFEFSMIDQDEFNKIDDYIRHRKVADQSMSTTMKGKSTLKNEVSELVTLVAEAPEGDDDDDDESFHSEMGSDSGSEGSDSDIDSDEEPKQVFSKNVEEEDLSEDIGSEDSGESDMEEVEM
ncbi:hypothetical protein BABINDRAFT_10551 [Babjeviella inositovora NRRL Y-12698]|uniref:Histone chaperone RTT106 n=1 Tax=Babjeviella inositovora NRRL Y-12698 TaxID=984486 RepID=A0A1E3QHE0_9ASCO|nr:uncharacterized protein BABINDRAFT_10551 [Babjeviella inositovora NRRL Y-12698]ODQ77018.1 hypothetical protein BABINDRAFT_10551 [Babjeviella inositovora NRRL Y-12698]